MSDCGSSSNKDESVALLATAVQVHAAEYSAKIGDLAARIEVLETWHTWATRLVLSLVITAVLGIVVAGATIGVHFGGR